jgi:hypothetical protein
MLVVIKPSVIILKAVYDNAECQYVECRYSECRGATATAATNMGCPHSRLGLRVETAASKMLLIFFVKKYINCKSKFLLRV